MSSGFQVAGSRRPSSPLDCSLCVAVMRVCACMLLACSFPPPISGSGVVVPPVPPHPMHDADRPPEPRPHTSSPLKLATQLTGSRFSMANERAAGSADTGPATYIEQTDRRCELSWAASAPHSPVVVVLGPRPIRMRRPHPIVLGLLRHRLGMLGIVALRSLPLDT